MERLAPEKRGNQKAVGAQGAARLNKAADRVVGPVKRERVNHQIMHSGLERQDVGIFTSGRFEPAAAPYLRPASHDRRRCKGFVNLGEPFLNLVQNGVVKEKGRAIRKGSGPGAVPG